MSWFFIEFIIRFICCPSKLKFIKKLSNWIDLFSILPYLILYVLPHDIPSIIRKIFRMLRVLLLFKITRFSAGLQSLSETIQKSTKELLFLILYLAIGIVFFSSLVFYCEFEENSKFTSIPETFWWGVITMTSWLY